MNLKYIKHKSYIKTHIWYEWLKLVIGQMSYFRFELTEVQTSSRIDYTQGKGQRNTRTHYFVVKINRYMNIWMLKLQ